jgi:hypothetical protein
MTDINLVGRQTKYAQVVAAALACIILSACSVSRISPAYVPQGLLKENGSSRVPVAVSIVDHISNTAPAQSGAPGFFLFRHNPAGEQLICDSCAYQFGALPVEIVKGLVTSALQREGASLTADASRRVEVQVLQFEFFEPARNAGVAVKWQGRVGLRAIVTDHGSPVADWSYHEANVFSPGSTVFRGDIEEWASRTVSLSVEHVLSDSRISEALNRP